MPSESLVAAPETSGEEQSAAPAGSDRSAAPNDVAQLRKHLQSLRQQIERVEGWVESSLCASPAAAPPESASPALSARVDELLTGLGRLERSLNGPRTRPESSEGSVDVHLPMLAALIQESHKKLNARLKGIEESLATLLAEGRDVRGALEQALHPPVETVSPPEQILAEELPAAADPGIIDLGTLLGRELVQDPRTADALAELTRRLADDDPGAVGLVGQLLTWRAASRERFPKLLGDVGDAYYACFPRTTDQVSPLEQALVDILVRRCAECDVPNSIELVRIGERFAPSRHRMRAGDRGVEVTEIYGWVVVGPDGQILNRAQVGVK